MTRVLHVISGLHAGGAETQLPVLIADPRWDCEVVSFSPGGVVAARLRAAGTPVHDVVARGRRTPLAVLELAALVRRGRYDVVHLHLFRPLVLGSLAARLGGAARVVYTEHSLNRELVEGRPVSPAVRRLYRWAGRRLDAAVAVSPEVAQRLIEVGVPADRVCVVPNALAPQPSAASRASARSRLGLAPDAVAVGVVGRLVAPKRVDVLLEALAPLLTGSTRLVVVGDGVERPALGAVAADLGVADRVLFTGEVDDVPSVLEALDLLVSPSPEETFGLAVVEARLAGLPVVYADCPGLEPFRQGDPLVRRVPSDVAALRDALRGLLAALPDRAAAPAALAERYDPVRTRDLLDHVYTRAVPLPAPSEART